MHEMSSNLIFKNWEIVAFLENNSDSFDIVHKNSNKKTRINGHIMVGEIFLQKEDLRLVETWLKSKTKLSF